jgi:hypothetical protein
VPPGRCRGCAALGCALEGKPLVACINALLGFLARRLRPVAKSHRSDALGLVDMRDPVDVEIFADEIDAKVAARVFNGAYLSGVRSAVVERAPRGWVVRVYQYAPVGYLAPKMEAST